MVTDEIQQFKTELAGLVREQADRAALHQQKAAAINAEAHEYMTKQALAAERYLEHRRELGLREAEPEDKENDEEDEEDEERPDGVTELDFEPEDDEDEVDPPLAYDPPAAPVPPPPAFEPPAPPRARVPERTPRRSSRPPVVEEDDDDDFLNLGWRE